VASQGTIRIGIGGWTFEPWRTTFYPQEVAKTRELEYASRQVTAIEINSTFYRMMSKDVFAKWRAQTPDDFMFSVKAARSIVQRKDLREGADSIDYFIKNCASGLAEKLGAILWQLPPSKRFSHAEIDAFCRLLPHEFDGRPVRHAFEVRHKSFMCDEYLALAREHGIATVFVDSAPYPSFSDVTGSFIYARLRSAQADIPTGYSSESIAAWANRAQLWSNGDYPQDLPHIGPQLSKREPRDVFIYFINGAKERAPAAAMGLIERVRGLTVES
jgi:uncharacterized protein YecE (DUF72 family)